MARNTICAGVAAAAMSLAALSMTAPAHAAEGFEQADRNSDGVIDEQEFYSATQGGSHMIYDKNEDGVLDEAEYMDAMNQLPTGGDIDAGQADTGGAADAAGGSDAASGGGEAGADVQ